MRLNDLRMELHRQIEHAPPSGPIAGGLLGWWVSVEGGDVFLCSKCAGRIVSRGFGLPRGGVAVFDDKPEPIGKCICCG